MNDLVMPVLSVLLTLSAANLCLASVMWWRHYGLASRVAQLEGMASRITRLEVYQEQNLTHAETRQIYERLSSIEGQIQTTNRLMQTVQEHLLEND